MKPKAPKAPPLVKTTLRLPKLLHTELLDHCRSEGRALQWVMAEALRQYLAKKGK